MNSRLLLLLALSTSNFLSCGVKQSEFDIVKTELETAKKQLEKDSVRIFNLQDTIKMLSLPANRRLSLINEQVANGEYNRAKKNIDELKCLFPNSIESQQSTAILQRIDSLIAKQRAEEERVKALGFKSLKPVSSAIIEYNKVSFSGLSVSNTYVHDSYDSRYFYNRADRGNTFILATMAVTSESHNPDIPTLAVYSINGDKMQIESVMRLEFAQWKDYGAYLGNHTDFGNDFSKTSTIRFKLGSEVSLDLMKKPYAIVLKKYNGLARKNNRYDNPAISYSGNMMYPHTLSLEDFTGDNARYVIIKIANL